MILTNNAKTCREHTNIRSETKLITNEFLCFLRGLFDSKFLIFRKKLYGTKNLIRNSLPSFPCKLNMFLLEIRIILPNY